MIGKSFSNALPLVFLPLLRKRFHQPLGIFQSAPAQSPSPGLAEKYLSNFPVSSQ